MTGPEVMHLHFGAAEVNGRLGREGHRRWTGQRLWSIGHRRARILVAEDGGVLQEPDVTAGVIAVVMRADHVFHRLAGDRLDQGDDLVVVALEHVVDQEHTVVGDADRKRVGARVEDGVQPRLDRLYSQLRRRRPALPRLADDAGHQAGRNHASKNRDSMHGRIIVA
jgi:hypothetical protein